MIVQTDASRQSSFAEKPISNNGDLLNRAKEYGVKGLRKGMTDDAVSLRIKQYRAGEIAEKYIEEGKKSGLPQYQPVDIEAAKKFAAIISANPYSIDTRNWVFDSRGIKNIEPIVTGKIIDAGNDKYKHNISGVGRELVKVLLTKPKTFSDLLDKEAVQAEAAPAGAQQQKKESDHGLQKRRREGQVAPANEGQAVSGGTDAPAASETAKKAPRGVLKKKADAAAAKEAKQTEGKSDTPSVFSLSRDGDAHANPVKLPFAIDAVTADRHVARFLSSLGAAPRYSVVDSVSDLPDQIKRDAAAQNADQRNTKGVFHDGVLYVVRSNISGLKDLEQTVAHEVIGHYGLRRLFGAGFINKAASLFFKMGGYEGIRDLSRRNGFGDAMEDYIAGLDHAKKENPLRYREAIARAILTEEVFAHLAEKKQTLWHQFRALVGKVRSWFRDHGFMKLASYGDTDILHLLNQAKQAAQDTATEKNQDSGHDLGGPGAKASLAGVSPADKAIYGMANDKASAKDILSFIAKASRNPFHRQLAKLLMRTGLETTTAVGDGKGWKFDAGNNRSYAAAYSIKEDRAYLFRPGDAERHMLHEFVHAATMKAIRKGGLAAIQMRALFRTVQKSRQLAAMYGMENVDEFVAEAFTNPDFQRALKQVSAPGASGIKNAWNWLIRILKGILGLPTKSENALSAALDLGVGLMRENMQAAASQGGIAYSQSAMKSTDANIARGMNAMTQAITEQNTVHRAMFRNGLGWVDFVWGDKNKGIQHIITQRMGKDGLSHADVVRMLTEKLVGVIAKGKEIRRQEFGGSLRAVVEFNGHEAVLVRNPGANSWLLSGWKITPDAEKAANDTNPTTHPSADSSDGLAGAGIDSIVTQAEKNSNDPDIRYSLDNPRHYVNSAVDRLNDYFNYPGKLSLWHKTVGTMYNLAERSPAFKKVFNSAQGFVDDVSHYASDAADHAPRWLPRLDTFGDLKKSPVSAEDSQSVAKPIFEGTLNWGRDLAGKPVLIQDLVDAASSFWGMAAAAELVQEVEAAHRKHEGESRTPRQGFENRFSMLRKSTAKSNIKRQ